MDTAVRTEVIGAGDQSWLGSAHGTNMCTTITISKASLTLATHYPDGYLKSGEPLGKITASGKYGPYDNAAVDGREVLVGHLFTAQHVGTGDIVAPLFDHGRVIEAKLPRAVDAPGKTDVAGRIRYV